MRRALKLHHHKHTGKLIHHRHTSYWALALLILVSGAFTFCIDRMVMADSLIVSATVPAPIPSDAPVITSPADNYTSNKPEVTFTGTCPVINPAIVITLYSGSVLLGSVQCSSSGSFTITGTLAPGSQVITAKVVTITGQDGQTSAPIHISYTPPTNPVTPPTPQQDKPPIYVPQTTNQQPNESTDHPVIKSPLAISPGTSFVTYRPGIGTTIEMKFTGGETPYEVRLNWGDGTVEIKKIGDHQVYTFSHVYESSGYYSLLVTTIDATGQHLTTHYAVIDLSPKVAPAGTTAASFLDTASAALLTVPLLLYPLLFASVLLLWRYEHTHHRQRVGLPMHYNWQQKNHNK